MWIFTFSATMWTWCVLYIIFAFRLKCFDVWVFMNVCVWMRGALLRSTQWYFHRQNWALCLNKTWKIDKTSNASTEFHTWNSTDKPQLNCRCVLWSKWWITLVINIMILITYTRMNRRWANQHCPADFCGVHNQQKMCANNNYHCCVRRRRRCRNVNMEEVSGNGDDNSNSS